MEKNKILKMWSFVVVVGERKEQNIKHEIWDYYYGCFSSALSWSVSAAPTDFNMFPAQQPFWIQIKCTKGNFS